MPVAVAFLLGVVVGGGLLALAFATVGRGALRRAARRLPPRVPVADGEELVWTYRFPDGLWAKVAAAHPEVRPDHAPLLEQGLREWLTLCVHARDRTIGMPSRTVDWAWHELVLHTAEYRELCDAVAGRPLEHRPAAVMDRPMDEALADARATWEATGRAAAGHEPVLWTCDLEILRPTA